MSLPEDLRQEYLETLGIVSYFPRFILPAAPKPEPCEWSEAWKLQRLADTQAISQQIGQIPAQTTSAEASTQASTQASTGSSATVIVQTGQLACEPASPPPEPRLEPESSRPRVSSRHSPERELPQTDVQATKATNKRKSSLEEIRLQLLCIRVNDNLAILNAMPHFGPGQLSRQHMALLQNMLSANSINPQSLLVDEKPFHWPMVQGEFVDNSKSAAATALVAFLQQKKVDWQFKSLLVMGEQVVTRLFTASEEDNADVEDGGTKSAKVSTSAGKSARESAADSADSPAHSSTPAIMPTMESQAWETFYARSLDEILQTPVLKKELWSITRKIRH